MEEFFGEAIEDPVELVPYDPAWPERFQRFSQQIRGALGADVRIDHIGSTSVPGLLAKPVIDIQVAVADLDAEHLYRPALETLGWPLRGRSELRRFFRPPKGQPRTVHVHVVQAASQYEFDHLLFRDFLCVHPQVRDTYARLKVDLSAEHVQDRRRYTPAKAPFIAATLDDARTWAKTIGRTIGQLTAASEPGRTRPCAPVGGGPTPPVQANWDPPRAGESVSDYLHRVAEVFQCFDRQDSGCVSYGLQVGGRSWFAKTATTPAAAASLRNAVSVHTVVHHSAVIGIDRDLTIDGALLLIYPWLPGEVLYHATVPPSVTRRDPASAIARFRALPITEILDALDVVLQAHIAVEAAGLVAVDFYDGCLMYDFQAKAMRLCDLDEYRPGPFVLETDRLPGSNRYMAPEQHRRGALIDTRTTVYSLGRMLRLLLDAGDDEAAWRGSARQLDVIERATRTDPEQRWGSVAGLAAAWARTADPAE